MVTPQVAACDPWQGSPQEKIYESAFGVAVSVTAGPGSNSSEQSGPQWMPACWPSESTVPPPVPLLVTVKTGLEKCAVTCLLRDMVTWQTDSDAVVQPSHPVTGAPASPEAVKVT